MRNNDHDIHLLFNDPRRFVETHQKTIQYVVNKFVLTGFFTYHDRDEVVQYVNEKLLTGKIEKMRKQYNRNYYVATYLSKIIHNLCLEYSRKNRSRNRESTGIDISSLDVTENADAESNIIIEEESRRLDAILSMYNKSRPRIELFLKILCGAGFKEDEILSLYPEANRKDVEKLVHQCTPASDHDKKTDKELYGALTYFINKYDRKKNTADALRKWIAAKINEIIGLLNGDPKTAHYEKETLKILFQFRNKNLHSRTSI